MKKLINIIIPITYGIALISVAAAFSGPVTHPPAGNPTFWMKSGNDVYYNVVNGNVGIGTNGPAYKLDVQNGQINSSGGFCIAGNCKTDWNQIAGYWTLNGSSLYPNLTSYILGVGTASLDPNYKITTSGGGIKAESTSQPAGYFSSVSGYGLLVNTGYVGIGTTAPSELLEVSKSQVGYTAIKVTNSEDAGNASTGFTAKGGAGNRGGSLVYYGPGYTPGGGSELLAANSVVISSHSGVTNGIRIIAANDGTHSAPIIFATGQWYATAAERMRITSTGNVGIGTNNPGAKLEVAGQIKITGGSPAAGKVLTSDANGLASWQTVAGGGIGGSGLANYVPKFTDDTTLGNSAIYDSGGSVGIGTVSPGATLDVAGNIRFGSGNKVTFNMSSIGSNPTCSGDQFMRKWNATTCTTGGSPCIDAPCTTGSGWGGAATPPECDYIKKIVQGMVTNCVWSTCQASSWSEAMCISH
jgi:hypothetical protein